MVSTFWRVTLCAAIITGIWSFQVFAYDACGSGCGDCSYSRPTASRCGGCGDCETDDGWDFKLAPYVWFAGVDATIGIGETQGNIDAEFTDVLENLEYAGMLYLETSNEPWTIFADIQYIALDKETGRRFADYETDLDQLIAEIGARYVVADGEWKVEPLVGVRFVDLSTTIWANESEVAARDVDWVDPFVGLRLETCTSDHSYFAMRGDVGGFGVGSELSWGANAQFGWELSDSTTVALGYKFLDFDYEDGDFSFGARMDGPFLGFSFDV